MSKFFKLGEMAEGQLCEIVAIDDENISQQIGAYQGMSVVILKKALQSIVQFGYSQIEIEKELLNKITVQRVNLGMI